MKLIYRITLRLSISLLGLLSLWALFFYLILVDEINDETDDALEDYSEQIITRALGGEPLPPADNGTNNTYYITSVTSDYAREYDDIRYFNEMVYIAALEEEEPARVLKTVFRDQNDQYYELTVAIPTFEGEDLRLTILEWLLILYFLLLLAIVGINVWVFYRSLRPLYTLLEWLDSFNVGRPTPPLDNPTPITEFRKLNEAALRSARRNEELFDQQKQFIGNAAHELQTPLAVCQNRLEALLDDDTLSEHQLSELLKTMGTLDSLVRLNKTLLLLSRIDNGQYPQTAPVDLGALIARLSDNFQEIYAHLGIALQLSRPASLIAELNPELASILLSNLLKNAFVHNRPGGHIDITVLSDRIILRNTGDETPLDASRIFDRFYRGSAREGSSGLGLALVRSICTLYQITIRYSFDKQEHVFELFFKKNDPHTSIS